MKCLCESQTYSKNFEACTKQTCSVKDFLVAYRVRETTCEIPARNEGETTKHASWALFAIVLMAVVARFVFRAPSVSGSGYGADDHTIALAFLLMIPLSVITHELTRMGLGRDIWRLPFENITNIMYSYWVGQFLYVWIMSMTKISILALYLRVWIADPIVRRDWFRLACSGMIIILASYAVVMSLTLGFECNPINFTWLRWDGEHEGTCIDLNAHGLALAAFNTVQDLIICLLPLPKLFAFDLSLRDKLIVGTMFSVGLFLTSCSIVRLQYVIQLDTTDNLTFAYNPVCLWSTIECGVAIICACLPSVVGLAQHAYGYKLSAQELIDRASCLSECKAGPNQPWHELESPVLGRDMVRIKGPFVREISEWD
ncbi:hypothetical protein CB0940_09698 [Cercospora beticola]|uniref:Rhodopsin domain-containing protein n=1 Tax=Cercospora beticola TaxID=122368 RepID=A0A2G5HFZ3_CERBT|nr:hypothetical protein CB0940_09698 [Cercospora beticola]PIA91506.1 hypothetical protein CB0940_09698 [Cercospora beticola]WPB05962.1 hypothetical protein RHO25_010617 [Cercospora beticola]CAK1365838.1 unnamed protein product [Cercospora beticola]